MTAWRMVVMYNRQYYGVSFEVYFEQEGSRETQMNYLLQQGLIR